VRSTRYFDMDATRASVSEVGFVWVGNADYLDEAAKRKPNISVPLFECGAWKFSQRFFTCGCPNDPPNGVTTAPHPTEPHGHQPTARTARGPCFGLDVLTSFY